MKKMSALFLVLACIALSNSAYSAAPVLHDIECHDSANYWSVRVDIELVQSGAQIKPHVTWVAGIFQPDSQGVPQLVDRVEVRRSQNPNPGAPRVYSGVGFEMTVQMTATPLPDGSFSGHLEADTRAGKISEEMICRIAR